MSLLTVLDTIPEGLLELDASSLHRLLDGPTLLHLAGARAPTLFVSTLLHGNEHTSWEATKRLLHSYQGRDLPRCISIFIGNVAAAEKNQRYLDGGEDYNRIWGRKNDPAHPIMQQVLDEMHTRGVFLSVDIHNNTGKNPHYSCVNRLEKNYLYLASLFSRDIVYFLKPDGVQSMAFAELCPAVTVECGLSGEESGTQHAYEFLQTCFCLGEFPQDVLAKESLNIYHTVAIAKMNPEYEFAFGSDGRDSNSASVVLNAGLEKTNFQELQEGTEIGWVLEGVCNPIQVWSEEGIDVSNSYLSIDSGVIRVQRKLIPAMFTLDAGTIKKDCLCYFMEKYPLDFIDQ